MMLPDLLERQRENDKIAVRQGGRALSYRAWYEYSRELAERLNDLLGARSRCVALFLPNSIEYAAAYFGVLFAGRVVVPIGTEVKAPELMSTLAYCEADVLLCLERSAAVLRESLREYPYRLILLPVDGGEAEILHGERPKVPKTGQPESDGSPDDVTLLLHTSGTTSDPKRVMLTHRNLLCNVESHCASLGLCADDRVLIALPMYFGYCNTAQFLSHLALGGSMVILDGMFLPKRFFELAQAAEVTNFTAVPSMLLMLLEYRHAGRYDLGRLHTVCFGGGFMPEGALARLMKRFPAVNFVQTYGQTEASPRATLLKACDALRKAGSVGRTIPGVELSVFDASDHPLPAGSVGEVVIRGKNVMRGYFKQEALPRRALRGGWLHTGDMGFLDEEGYLYLAGRKKNMIISGGINLYPEEIEEILLGHPNVCEARVWGEEHPYLVEAPVASVVLRKPDDPPDLFAYCEPRLARYKIPVRFEFVKELPKTYNGKLKRG